MRPVFPIWVFAVVAMAIALTAFAAGQMEPGIGVAFTAFATTLWVAYVAKRGAIARRG